MDPDHTDRATILRAREIAERSDRIALALEVSGTGVWEYEIATGQLYLSPACLEMVGASEADFHGTISQFESALHRDDRQRVADAMLAAIARRDVFEADFRVVRRDGSVRWIRDRGRFVFDEGGRPVRVLGIAQDVTSQRELERALAEREEDHRRLVELSPDAIFIYDLDGLYFANPAGLALLGATSCDEVIGRSPLEFLDAEFHELARARAERVLAGGEAPAAIDLRLRRLDGSLVPIETKVSRVHFQGRSAVQIIVRDITQRKADEQALRDSEQLFRERIDALPQQVWTTDPAGRFDFVNQRLRDYTGFSVEDADRWLESIHPDDRERSAASWQRAIETGEDLRIEVRMLDTAGRARWFDVRANPVRDRDGHIVRWVGSCTDVQPLHEAQDALHAEESRFEQIARVAPGGIHTFRVDPDGHISYPWASAGCESILGFPATMLARNASPVLARVHPEDVANMQAAARRSLETGAVWIAEFRYRHPDGRELWLEGRSVPEREPDGGLLWHGFVLDVTERKNAEDALRTSKAQLVTALRAGKMGAWTWDFETALLRGDPWAMSLWGFPGETPHVPWSAIEARIHPDDLPHVRERRAAFVKGDGFPQMGRPYRVLRPDGDFVWISTHAVIERDPSGKPLRMVGVHTDVTDRKRAEEALLRSQKLEALGTLAGGIAHDFNNILAAITGNAELAALELPDGHPAALAVAEIERASARAADLVRQILSFSRPEERSRERMALAPIVDEVMRMVRATLPAMIAIRTKLDTDLPLVPVDATQIHQALVNLVTNAAHAIGDRAGRIEIRVERREPPTRDAALPDLLRTGRWLCCSVRDDGGGMDAATLARVFDPFFTTKKNGGTGLGLSVVHGIMQAHGGAVTAESEPGRGSCFRLWFPEESAPVAAPSAAAAEPGPEPAAPRGARILYVDDERAIVDVARHALEQRGYRVAAFTDPGEALAAFRAHPRAFDVVVTDFAMPKTSGFEFATELVAARRDVPILLTSGYLQPGDRERARRAGVREVLLKPYSMKQLVRCVGELAGGVAAAAPG